LESDFIPVSAVPAELFRSQLYPYFLQQKKLFISSRQLLFGDGNQSFGQGDIVLGLAGMLLPLKARA
jgi:hypothetical protein